VTIFNQQSTRKNKKFNTNPLDFANTLFKSLKPAKPANPLSKEKKKDIETMIRFMSDVDKKYMGALLKN